jgi:hypothetical protein
MKLMCLTYVSGRLIETYETKHIWDLKIGFAEIFCFYAKNVHDYNPTLSLDAQCNCMVFFFLWGGGLMTKGQT